jgi:hypothetical protein
MAETRQITRSNWIESLRVLVPKFEINGSLPGECALAGDEENKC